MDSVSQVEVCMTDPHSASRESIWQESLKDFFWAIFQDMAAMFASVGMSEQAVEAYTKVRAMCTVRLDLNGYWW